MPLKDARETPRLRVKVLVSGPVGKNGYQESYGGCARAWNVFGKREAA